MQNLKIYDIWLAELPSHDGSHVQQGCRPVLVVSNDKANTYSPVITVVPISSRINKYHLPTHVRLDNVGLIRTSIALCEQVMAMDTSRLIRRVGEISSVNEQLAVRRALCAQLGMPA